MQGESQGESQASSKADSQGGGSARAEGRAEGKRTAATEGRPVVMLTGFVDSEKDRLTKLLTSQFKGQVGPRPPLDLHSTDPTPAATLNLYPYYPGP